ncbi:MAG: hypothetical protein R6W70_00960 [bacterium]
MEKETSISEKINRLAENSTDICEMFSKISAFLKREYSVKMYFCKITGQRRWSWMAGYSDILFTSRKIQINENYGIITDSSENLDEKDWKNIALTIKKFCLNSDNS